MTADPDAPLAEAAALTVTSRDGALQVRGLDFRLGRGEALVLVGPVDAGTAVLRAVAGVEPPGSGSARLLRREAATLSRREARSLLLRVGYVPRSGALLANLTLRENLLLPLGFHVGASAAASAGVASAALARFGLAEAPDLRPDAAPLPLRRRVALARALVLDPEVLLLDDPVDDLEEDVASEVLAALAAWLGEAPRGLLLTAPRPLPAGPLRARSLPLPVTRA